MKKRMANTQRLIIKRKRMLAAIKFEDYDFFLLDEIISGMRPYNNPDCVHRIMLAGHGISKDLVKCPFLFRPKMSVVGIKGLKVREGEIYEAEWAVHLDNFLEDGLVVVYNMLFTSEEYDVVTLEEAKEKGVVVHPLERDPHFIVTLNTVKNR